jgi:hypothetical protein
MLKTKPKQKKSKIRQSARGEDCLIRIPGYCNFNSETTVLCHKNGGGAGMKSNDIHGAYGCSSCHDVIDGRIQTEFTQDEIRVMFYEGIFRTQLILIDKELIK